MPTHHETTREIGGEINTETTHTFAVNRLIAWYRDSQDVNARIPELSVYLGHARPQNTYWYLSATAELLELAAQRFEVRALPGGSP